jgi:hypothetical protein
LDISETIASNQVGEAFGPSRLVYNIRSTGGTNPGGEKYGGINYRVDLDKGECSCNIPQLLHVPCSHVIIACRCWGLDHKSEKFMSPFYLMSNTLKLWESSFEPYLDLTQWLQYYRLDYVSDPDLLKTKKGRRKKSGCVALWTHVTGMVKICTVLGTLMRHRVRSIALNATKLVTPLPLMISVRRQAN